MAEYLRNNGTSHQICLYWCSRSKAYPAVATKADQQRQQLRCIYPLKTARLDILIFRFPIFPE